MAWGARNLISTQDFEDAARALGVVNCVEINQCVGCTRQFFNKSFLGDDAAVDGVDATPRRWRRRDLVSIASRHHAATPWVRLRENLTD